MARIPTRHSMQIRNKIWISIELQDREVLACFNSAFVIDQRSASDIDPKQGVPNAFPIYANICMSTAIYQQAKLKRLRRGEAEEYVLQERLRLLQSEKLQVKGSITILQDGRIGGKAFPGV